MKKIDLKKKYKTRDGHKVELHDIVLENSCGGLVTYPVKGTIYLDGKKNWGHQETRYTGWSIYGIQDVVFGNHSEWDLIEIK